MDLWGPRYQLVKPHMERSPSFILSLTDSIRIVEYVIVISILQATPYWWCKLDRAGLLWKTVRVSGSATRADLIYLYRWSKQACVYRWKDQENEY